MDKKKVVAASSSSSSSFDHIFGPRVSSSSSSATTGLFTTIFPRPSAGMLGRQMDFPSQGGHAKYQSAHERGKRSNIKEKNSYHNEETEPPCNLSSSIYYGGQEKYSSTTNTNKDTVSRSRNYHTHNTYYKKDAQEGDSKSASRGNWWEGSLYY
ncbi:uncharacterized protein LOC108852086 isoform X1 [Raphanus sativus]|uniref:Uncharacterized protein LOC108852086 isoform X1 n=1 Tax=Raphanus sativus TaxID=3726 RepID=A0A6J0N8P7_RAPSA|nr:uncharacterized protein LOC108852086 isoform X1 [Raphanus sativus]XP_018481077.1 uncharacterized protein LOC108852086 isoform X1 [Raphanus sativus]